ncbi:MAG: RNA polymerase factor sigma-54 [Methylococcales bacterium]|nr:RNA polymerase factor sigma-54 [Methylococcales bacterium]
MRQSLQLKLGQSLTMTPQLQQAIRLLQLSTLDLQLEIQQTLDSNMMLEVDEEETQATEQNEYPATRETPEAAVDQAIDTGIPDELPLDAGWDDIYDTLPIAQALTDEQDNSFERLASCAQSLADYLLWQLELSRFSERDHAIAIALIDVINDEGYLTETLSSVQQGLADQMDELELDELEYVLHRVQQFDPVGVAARDLSECLALQLRQLPETVPHRDVALRLVTEFSSTLIEQDSAKLQRQLTIDAAQLDQVLALLRTLTPKPGALIMDPEPDYVIPDVYVSKVQGSWQVSLNQETVPKLKVNPYYFSLIKRADNSTDNQRMRDHLQEARWFLKCLHSRNETLLNVARVIVDKQQSFFEFGPIAMRPMVLRDVAEALAMHESTISRVTTQKYMRTPMGLFEFKYFFSSHVSTTGGGECSSTAIRALIKELVDSENPAKPLSDQKIADLLKEKGIDVARRTIAKYREALNIGTSSQRKRRL